MKLTDQECKNAKGEKNPRKPDKDYTNKSYKLSDGGSLFLLVKPDGRKYWRLKYRMNGSEKLMALGV